MIENRLYNTLSNDTDITDLVGTRIFPVAIPEKTDYPCISYQTISNTDTTTMNNDLPTLNFKRLQVNVWSDKYSEVKTLELLVRNAIYTGEIKGRVEAIRDNNDSELKIFGINIDISANNK